MSNRRVDSAESAKKSDNLDDAPAETNPISKLDRRRRIEDLLEERHLRQELGDFDLV